MRTVKRSVDGELIMIIVRDPGLTTVRLYGQLLSVEPVPFEDFAIKFLSDSVLIGKTTISAT